MLSLSGLALKLFSLGVELAYLGISQLDVSNGQVFFVIVQVIAAGDQRVPLLDDPSQRHLCGRDFVVRSDFYHRSIFHRLAVSKWRVGLKHSACRSKTNCPKQHRRDIILLSVLLDGSLTSRTVLFPGCYRIVVRHAPSGAAANVHLHLIYRRWNCCICCYCLKLFGLEV